jgi:type VI secretion system protein ImpE
MTPYELYREERLDEALQAAIGAVKAAPRDADGRLLLCTLLALTGQFERVDGHLDVLVDQDPELAPGLSVYRQLVRAEIARRNLFESGQPPELMPADSDVLHHHVRAAVALSQSKGADAAGLLREAEPLRPAVAGECDGARFDELRDLDDLVSPCLEVLTMTGKYYWVGWERIQELQFQPPKYLRDLLWRPAQMTLRDGPDAVVYVPVLYAGSHRSQDPGLRTGGKTDWVHGESGIVRGVGQRTLLVGDGDKPLLSIGRIAFSSGGAAAQVDV